MLALAAVATAAFALINAFGAWVTQFRRRWLAWLFLIAALLLVLALVALMYRVERALWPLAAGLLLTWLSSFLHARLVTRHFRPLNHLLRAVAVAFVFALALQALG